MITVLRIFMQNMMAMKSQWTFIPAWLKGAFQRELCGMYLNGMNCIRMN